MAECGLLGTVLGGVAYLASFEKLVKAEAALGAEPDAVRRLGAIGVMGQGRCRTADVPIAIIRCRSPSGFLLWKVGGGLRRMLMHSRRGRCSTGLGRNPLSTACSSPGRGPMRARPTTTGGNWPRLPQHWSAPDFPLKAADLMQRGIQAGPALGNALRAAETAWIAADFPAERSI